MWQKEVISMRGKSDPRFVNETDNPLGILVLKNIVMAPMLDVKGILHGVVMLFNKLDSKITKVDIQTLMFFAKVFAA